VCAAISTYSEIYGVWKQSGLELIAVPTFNNPIQALMSLVTRNEISSITEKLRAFNPDVLLFPMFHPWNTVIQNNFKHLPALVFAHDPQPHPDYSGLFYEKLENSSIRRAARCVVMSEILKPVLARRGIVPEKIDVIPIGPLTYSPTIKVGNKSNRLPTLLFFGRIAPYKGLEILLEAYGRIKKILPCRLRIAGDGNLTPYKNLLAKMTDVEIINRWIAEDEVGDFFIESDLVVLPYTSASQSGVIPIAATFALPVIATRAGGLPEQIEDGLSGWLIPPGNVAALTDAIHAALTQPELARQRGAALKDRYEKLFGWDRTAHQIEKILIDLKQAQCPE
jgi:glycosyltransferase involved in cell wall biosynthesis